MPLLTGSSFVLLLPTIASIISSTLADSSMDTTAIDHKSIWRRFVETAQKRAEPLSHEAAAMIGAATSSRFDCLTELKATLRTLKVGTSFIGQQCVTRILGAFDYGPHSACRELVDIAIDRLTKLLDPKVCLPPYDPAKGQLSSWIAVRQNVPTFKSIEAKRNALDSLGHIAAVFWQDAKVGT